MIEGKAINKLIGLQDRDSSFPRSEKSRYFIVEDLGVWSPLISHAKIVFQFTCTPIDYIFM